MKNRHLYVATIATIAALSAGCKTVSKSSLSDDQGRNDWFQVFDPISDAERQNARTAFMSINGDGWDSASMILDNFTAIPTSGYNRTSGANTNATAEQIEKKIREFLNRNLETFRISGDNLADVQIKNSVESTDKWQARSKQLIAYSGYESIPDFGFQINFEFAINNGEIRSFINRSQILPTPISVVSESRVKSDDPKIRDAVVGQVFSYANFAGIDTKTPPVQDQDIQSVRLLMTTRRMDNGHLWLGLVYAVTVKLGDLTWTAYISSDSARLQWVDQNFFT